MSLYDKQLVWHGLHITSKAGRTLHLVYSTEQMTTYCGHSIGKRWQYMFGPVARYRTCERCRTHIDK